MRNREKKIKADHDEDMRNIEKIKADHDEDMRNIEKIKADHDEDMRNMEKIKADHDEDMRNIEKKIKADHDEDMRNIEKKIKADHDEDMRNIEKKIKTDHDEDMRNIEKNTKETEMWRKSLSTKQPITPVVGFHVALSKDSSGSGKVPFDKIISNYGGGYNSIIHTFKVPTKGLYFLILTVMNNGSSQAYSWLMRGSTRVALSYAARGHLANLGTVSTVLPLDAGEHVYAKHETGTLHSYTPHHYTYLAGFLIQKSD